ncbi:MAG: bifunctional glycosyltransferase/class I SAM-dependent methyltransferase [Kiritimatiellia bacterium]
MQFSWDNRKALIFVVAYNAEKTIRSVLSRIPVEDLPAGTEVLVIDDCSADRTFEIARSAPDAVKGLKLTVLHNPENQGYGGNQKIGYQYAIENGFDAVALLHGDGQYAPEKLPEMIEPVMTGRLDLCMGSRMLTKGSALRNGMPLYKYAGNRILSCFQNRLLGMKLSEFHSGYRAYSVGALKRLPFRYNTNDFHFDTEIIIQMHVAGMRVGEIPIPTYYGDEICYVNGISYAWNVIKSTLALRLHRAGVFYRKNYDIAGDRPVYESKLGYPSSHTFAVSAVRPGSDVLDLMCGPGHVARELKKKGCSVTGIDAVEPDHGPFVKVIVRDIDVQGIPDEPGRYDYIIGLDCLEHLNEPEPILKTIRNKCYSERTTLIFTTANIGFFPVRLGLLAGQFNYGRQGILDLSHRRLYTFASFRRLIEQEGYRVTKIKGIPAPFPKALGENGFSSALLMINRLLAGICPGMFAYQIYVEAEFIPPLERLLSRSLEASS